MLRFPDDLSQARVLISNDDNIHSTGISVLEEGVRQFTDKVWVVAPEHEQSAAGHSLSIHKPLRIKEYDERHVSVFGTPTDSVLMGVQHVMKDGAPDLVVSGVNHGHNVADDVTYSGTVAAAIEAVLLGIPAVAFSLSMESHQAPEQDRWDLVRKWLPKILEKLQGLTWDYHVVLNVNFPVMSSLEAEPEIKVVPQGHYNMHADGIIECEDPRGRPYFWIGPPQYGVPYGEGVDIGALQRDCITVTPLSLNLTHKETLNKLESVFK